MGGVSGMNLMNMQAMLYAQAQQAAGMSDMHAPLSLNLHEHS